MLRKCQSRDLEEILKFNDNQNKGQDTGDIILSTWYNCLLPIESENFPNDQQKHRGDNFIRYISIVTLLKMCIN